MDINYKLISEHQKEKRESNDFKERRFEKWNEIYSLYRDKVKTNRLTQRQAVNIPIIRETLQTWISKIDEAPELRFESRGKDFKHKTGEIIVNEMWDYYFDKLRLDILDNLDKKVVGLQGRSFKICGFSKGEFFVDVIDPYDIDISPRVNPLDLNTAQYLIRKNIFKPLREILANDKYDHTAKMELKAYLDSKEGLIQAAESHEAYLEKVERLKNLGAHNYDDFNATEVLVEINESYKNVWNTKENKFVRHLIVIAADKVVLYNKPLKEAIGINRLPIISWASDPDLSDIWCDGIGDSVLTINKVTNIYISQDLENRTYRNFGMYFYNSMSGQFVPKGYDPKPFGMYAVPGNPAEVLQQMRIEPLNDTTQQIGFLKELIQSSVAQTPTERGEQTKSRTTLGEVELNLQQSTGRNQVVAKNYRRAWEEIGEIFYELLSANSRGMITLYKKGADGNTYKKDVLSHEWMYPEGYDCKVIIKAEKESLDQYGLQKAQYTIANFQDNPVALRLAKKKQLEMLGNWDTEEIEQVMAFYENQQQVPAESPPVPEPTGQATGRPFNNEQVMQQALA